jgi:hypothetical protein
MVQRIPARFQAGPLRGQGHIKNVSRQGVFVRADALPDPGTPVQILFLDRTQQKVEITGTVRWTTDQLPGVTADTPKGFGVLVDEPCPAFLDFFEQILVG